MKTKNLLHSVSNDERGSFDVFYHTYYEQIFRFAYYFLKDKESCKEVITDVFYAVWQSRKRLKDIENIETYLYIVVRNEVGRYQKRYNNPSHTSLDEIPIHLELSTDSSPEDDIQNKELEQILSKIVSELPEKCRVIFLMTYKEGLKTKQIAEILSIKESTVRVQMKIATDKIVEAVKPYFPYFTLAILTYICK
ncbi:RNA polymerase sigma-70 factor (family 1) [Parabacteroides sp. PF5-5]|uniref:RNA polymerase sigma factor n=1 Tax=unclassified Parabacteroides TaxID=2649774 RepID=UPI002473996E|nr:MULTISPECIES: RNA polymerase sigma-70 factor [unclassified Parabacteroides]MDH6305352.1 RNA polymerase sigma-70 factor (family 1) [Parabacteroides sp. PH5-39]MDH6316705.1 RNA polymerase sigma-70 factor (family 1) [Parabacteroides sp. PF5-13]MDH6320115.1 RNA polymerase sigma-70 factor (family 1) [Parabacteroides sp. PH5-13]MDH6323942.1 RNA polymerase sigma-70 factor (family 1) [Parabacteroides sp. PH5-8]MDH6327792.1 RNA polymerase sigma-70 factor (family 1) [Parabacteroides sp. PH5-41]